MTSPTRHIAAPLSEVAPIEQRAQIQELRNDFMASWLLAQGDETAQTLLLDYVAVFRHQQAGDEHSPALQALAAACSPRAIDATVPANHNISSSRPAEVRNRLEKHDREMLKMSRIFLAKLIQPPSVDERHVPQFLGDMIDHDARFIIQHETGRRIGSDPRESFVRSYILLNKQTGSVALNHLLAETKQQIPELLKQKDTQQSRDRLRTVGSIWSGFHPGQRFDPEHVTGLRFY